MPLRGTKFNRETFATTSFLKERGVFGPAEVVILSPADVVMLGPAEVEVVMFGPAVTISLGPAEVVMIVKTLDIMLAESSQSLRQR